MTTLWVLNLTESADYRPVPGLYASEDDALNWLAERARRGLQEEIDGVGDRVDGVEYGDDEVGPIPDDRDELIARYWSSNDRAYTLDECTVPPDSGTR